MSFLPHPFITTWQAAKTITVDPAGKKHRPLRTPSDTRLFSTFDLSCKRNIVRYNIKA